MPLLTVTRGPKAAPDDNEHLHSLDDTRAHPGMPLPPARFRPARLTRSPSSSGLQQNLRLTRWRYNSVRGPPTNRPRATRAPLWRNVLHLLPRPKTRLLDRLP